MVWKKALKCVSVTAVILIMLFAVVGCGVSNEDHQAVLDSASKLSADLDSKVKLNQELSTELATVKESVDVLSKELEDIKAVEVEETAIEVAELSGYKLDELSIGSVPAKCLSDKHVEKLLDVKVDWDGDDFDVEEFICIENGLDLSVNGEDFGSDVLMTAEVGSIRYVSQIDSDLDVEDIDDDKSLVVQLLGEEVEIIEWDEGQITLLKGTEHVLEDGQGVFIDGKNVELYTVGDDFAYVIVDGEREKILEGEVEEVNGLEIEVTEVLPTVAWRAGIATLRMGKEVSIEIEDGEEFEEDSAWEWYVGENELGLVLVEEFMYIDEDEEFQAGMDICLPEEYICVEFLGMDEVDVVSYNFDVDTKQGNEYLRVKGDFEFDMDDYSKLYISADGIFDSDLEELGSCIELDGTHYQLCLVDIGDEEVEFVVALVNDNEASSLFVALDLSDIVVGGVGSIASEDEDWISSYGVVFSSPEDAVDDEKLTVSVPEEMLTGVISVK